MALLGLGVWLFSALYYSLLMTYAYRVSKKVRVAYLRAILSQEIGWFDSNNPQELSARVSKETQAIEAALGEKFGDVLRSTGLVLSGFGIAFSRGWAFSLALLVLFPFITASGALLSSSLV
jgi:ATP-binding cassette subfamily B (MDR/TAP) protein 1